MNRKQATPKSATKWVYIVEDRYGNVFHSDSHPTEEIALTDLKNRLDDGSLGNVECDSEDADQLRKLTIDLYEVASHSSVDAARSEISLTVVRC